MAALLEAMLDRIPGKARGTRGKEWTERERMDGVCQLADDIAGPLTAG
jgi:hypothetical protein